MLARPVPSVTVAPVTLTTLLLPAFLSLKVPVWFARFKLSVSMPTKPFKVPPDKTASSVPSYTRLLALTPLTVNAFCAIVAVTPVALLTE